jgi:dolichyl-phosphate-mannose-protein mannosyltransferase
VTPFPLSSRHRDWFVGIFIGLLALVLFLFRLTQPAEPYFDETLHVFAANDWLYGRTMSDFAHPPGSRLLMAFGLWCGPGGFDVAHHAWTLSHIWWWRLPSALAGALCIGTVYAFGRDLKLPVHLAALAATLLMLDGVFFIHARIGMTNVFSTLYIVLAAAATWRAIQWDKPGYLLGTGVALGAALATRWTGVFALAALASAVLIWRRPWTISSPQQLDRWLLCGLAGFIFLPAAIYILAFLPLQGTAMAVATGAAVPTQGFWDVFIGVNRQLLRFHEYGIVHHPGHSPWWAWPWMLNPLWYYTWLNPHDGQLRAVLTIGNPFLWWAAIPAWGFCALRAIRSVDSSAGFVGWLGASLWLAWAATSRSTTFMTYFGESLPFASLALAMGIGALGRRWSFWLPPLYAGFAATWFIWTYPLLTAATLGVSDYEARLLSPRWDLMRQASQFRAQHGLESPARFEAYVDRLGNQKWRYKPGQMDPSSQEASPAIPKK